jgi:hypothetical protein
VREPVQNSLDVTGIVLPVGVNLDHAAVAVLLGVLESGTHRAANTHIEWELEDDGSCFTCHFGCVVTGAVVDDQYVTGRAEFEYFPDCVSY